MIHVTAVGRLTKGADLRTTNNGLSVANFTLACKRKRPDKDGNVPTAFIQCVLWGKPAQAFAKYTQKGSLLGVTGEIQTRSYDDQQGKTHYVTELIVDSFEFLESKATVQQREQQQTLPQQNQNSTLEDAPTSQQPSYEPPTYEQPPLSGMSDYGFNE